MTVCVSDIMSRDVLTLNEEDNLLHLREHMESRNFHHLPVLSGRRVVGLLTHRDILRLAFAELDHGVAAQARDFDESEGTFVASVMTQPVATVLASTPLQQAVELMLAHHYGCLPVVDDQDELVGLVTEYDLLRELGSLLREKS